MADGDFGAGKGGGSFGGGFGGSISNSTASNIGGAVSDLFAGFGDFAKSKNDLLEAGNYGLAAGLAGENATYTEYATKLKEMQQQREVALTQGSQIASTEGAGFNISGSAGDLLRESAAQGALAKGALEQQGFITEQGYKEQQQSYLTLQQAAQNAASAEKTAGYGSFISGAIKGVAAVASIALAPETGGLSLAGLSALAAPSG